MVLALSPCKPGDGIDNWPFAVYERKSYTKHAGGRGIRTAKKADTRTWGIFFFGGGVPLQWHRNEGIAMNTCIGELGYVMCTMLCVKFAFGHIFPSGGWDPNNDSSRMGYLHGQSGSPTCKRK